VRIGAGLLALSLVTLPFGRLQFPDAAAFVPALMFSGALVEGGIAVLLFVQLRGRPRRSGAFLASSFVGLALLSLAITFAFPLGPHGEALIPGGVRTISLLYPAWSVLVAVSVTVYLALGLRDRDGGLAEAYVLAAGLTVASLLVQAGMLTVQARLAGGMPLPGPPFGPSFVVTLALAALFAALAFRGRMHGFAAALRLAVLAVLLDATVNELSWRPYQLTWYVGHAFYLIAALLVFGGAVRDLLRWEDRAARAEQAVERATSAGRRHAQRLETLWRLAANTVLDDEGYLCALLGAAGSVLQAGTPFVGSIMHLDGTDFVVDVSYGALSDPLVLDPGSRYPAREMLVGHLLRGEPTQAWSDVRDDPATAATRGARLHGVRAFIGTVFWVGPTSYVLALASTSPLQTPLRALDRAYVETLASLCATRLHQRTQSDRLRHQTEHDALTGLLNRVAFRARGTALLKAGEPCALALVDVDGFRALNEQLGQQTADALLVEVGAMLAACRPDDVVARLSADDFAILVPGIGDAAEAERRLRPCLRGFDRPFTTGTLRGVREVRLRGRMGVALAPQHGTSVDDLLACAYAALDDARVRAVPWAVFDAARPHASRDGGHLRVELAAALQRGEFVLHYQPIVGLREPRVAGVEALLRWQHPQRGLLEPAAFVPFADAHALMAPIGTWIVDEVVRATSGWRDALPGFRVWFNVSASELRGADALAARLERQHVRGLGVEIAEAVAMQDVDAAAHGATVLRGAGLEVALDDFGAARSSLGHLQRLPIDVVKLDRSFVAGVPGDVRDEAIVEGVLSIGRRFGFRAVAEGVETADQARWLAQAGCGYAQGYHFARAMPFAAMDAWLAQRHETLRWASRM